jgi:endonuclease/exonuclease/phosphatase family metal-dependent hydrolase
MFKTFVIHTIAVLISFQAFSADNTDTSTIKKYNIHTTSNTLKILSWNIFMLPKIASLCNEIGKIKRNQRLEEIILKLNKSDFDIIALQEVFYSKAYKDIVKKLKEKYPYATSKINNHHLYKFHSGLLILSKYPIKSIESIEFEESIGCDKLALKGAVSIEIEVEGKDFKIINTHLQSEIPNQNYKSIQKSQIAQIQNSFLKNTNSNVTQIVCGDINIDKCDSVQFCFLNNTLLTDPIVENAQKFTWADYRNRMIKKEYLDHFLVVKNGLFLDMSTKVISDINSNKKLKLSDHFPIVMEIKLKLNAIAELEITYQK